MSDVTMGKDALNDLYKSDDDSNKGFSQFKDGTVYKVKVLGDEDLMGFMNYGIWKQVDSFVPEKPSKKSKKGYPIEDLTPWDKAWKYHKDQSDHYQDHHGTEASKYRVKQRYAMGFIDLDTGEPIVIDVSKPQATAIHTVIKKNKAKLGKKAFELSKEGSGKSTVVSLMPEDLEDLTEKQQKNFEKAPAEFDHSLFEGISYEASEDEQIESLDKAGFDVTLIGLQLPKKDGDQDGQDGQDGQAVDSDDNGEPIDISDEDLPF